MESLNCPKGHGQEEPKKLQRERSFKGVDIKYAAEVYVCPVCGLEAGSTWTAGDGQRAFVDACRKYSDF